MPEMQPLFASDGLRALAAALRGRPLLAFDFDGTLAPLVARPEDARVPPAIAHKLARLADLRPLAIVTGRAVADVATRLGFHAGFIVGNHGAEVSGLPTALDAAALDPIRRRLQAAVGAPGSAGMQFEDKRYSLAVHFRQAQDPLAAEALADALVAALPPALRMVPGRMVRNVVLAGAPDKGDAVVGLVQRTGSDLAVFVGDDVNDESVFACAPSGWLSVRVGTDDPASRAGYFLDSYDDIPVLLDRMLELLAAA
jgi:trehalose 6-phosphate phosphatase